MSYSVSTLLIRNLRDVFGENDPARRRAAIDEVRHQLTPGPISSLRRTAGSPPFISFSTSYPELPFTSASNSQGVSLS